MNRLTYWLRGYLRIRITGASVSWYLNEASAAALPFWHVVLRDEFTLELSIPRKEKATAHSVANRAMCQVEELGEYGAPRRLQKLLGRMMLVIILVLAAFFSAELSSRVWFFRVEGNVTVPAARILRAVQSCGVTYGTRGADIRPQTVKNEVLAQIEELAWLTVTHNGSDAVITVRERAPLPRVVNRKVYCDLVARRGGVISSVTVYEGAAAVRVGRSVAENDVLISGMVPLEQTVRVCGAEGEVYARTTHQSSVMTPKTYGKKAYSGKRLCRISLVVGKKRIKIYEDAGIFDAKCDKMTKKEFVVLSGNRVLPIAIETEQYHLFELQETARSLQDAEQMICRAAAQTAARDMVDGTLLRQECMLSVRTGTYFAEVTLEANEMIAVKSSIQRITGDTNDRARNQRGENGAAD